MPLDDAALDLLFREARSHNGWMDKGVPDELVHELYGIVRFGPTAANCCPARFLFLTSSRSKDKLATMVAGGNVDKVSTAPVVAVIGYDLNFHEHMPRLFAHNPRMKDIYSGDPELLQSTAFRNSSLQGAYLMLAARALGLDCGPMSGFNAAEVDAEFFADTSIKSNFICGLGYGDQSKLFGRLPRFEFAEACSIL